MSDKFQVGALVAEVGCKLQGYLTVVNGALELPITLINGKQPGPTIVITGGTHGGEYPGIETSIRLAAELTPEDVSGRVAIVHPVNLPAFFAKQQYVIPEDGRNLNRMFPGKALGTISERIAFVITTELHAQADFYVDLHGGDIHEALVPFVLYPAGCDPKVAERSRVAASYLGVPYVVGSYSTNGTFGSAAARGVAGFLAEIGQCGRWSEPEVQQYLRGVKNVLKHLGVLAGQPERLASITEMPRMVGVNAEQQGCWYPCVKVEEHVAEGQKVGEIRDFFGKVLGEYYAPVAGVILYVITSLAINSGDPLIAVGPIA
ncbi:MAG: M14 family metallopeptidase [Bacillota bacterium]